MARTVADRSPHHRRHDRRGWRRVAPAALVAVAASLVLAPPSAAAAATPTTYPGHTYGSGATAPSADKPQSKLWYNDGSWWALMAATSTVNIFQLQSDHTWRDTGVVVDTRVNSTADALWAPNGSLYVASRTAGSSGSIRISKLRYSSSSKTYSMDSGFPKALPGSGTESVTIDRDSLGRLWVTFTRGSAVYVTHSTTSPSTFVTPFRIPGADTDVSSDDLSAVIALDGKIGVMWSDQASSAFRFAVHNDSDPDTVWTEETPLEGSRLADDHVNLKSLLGDDQGRVHAAVKTSLGDDSGDPGTSPGILVLSRSIDGTWTQSVGATIAEQLTRPQLVLDRSNRQLFLMQSDEGGGTVYYKSSPLTDISFPGGKGAPFISWPGAAINNVSTAKDPVTADTGLVAFAADSSARRYYHAEMSLDGSTPPPGDTTAPTVTQTDPASGATDVPAADPVTATFSEAMDAGTIDASTFTLAGPAGAVPATVTYDPSSLRATVTPTSPLAAATTYTATVTTGVEDVAGNSLAEARSWSFSTEAESGGPETVTLSPVADSYVASNATSTNYGSSGVLVVDGKPITTSYLKYDLSAYAGRTIDSASLQVRVTSSGSTGKQSVKKVTNDSWSETGLTYKNRPALGTTLGTLGPTVPDTDYTVTLSRTALQSELGQALSLGLNSGSSDGVDLGSRETATPARLVLVLSQ